MSGEDVGFEVGRRGFLHLTSGVLAATSGGIQSVNQIQEEGEIRGLSDEVTGAEILLGPQKNRPDPEGGYFDQWERYHFVYVDTVQGSLSWIKDTEDNWQEIMANPETQTDEVRVSEFESFFNHTFARPNAPDDKNWSYTDADLTKDGSEIELSSTTSLTSEQRGNYPPGSEAIPGVAFRITSEPTGGEAFAGYFVDSDGDQVPDDGFGFGMDGSGTFTFIAKEGSVRRVYQSDWEGQDLIDDDPFLRHYPQICRFPHLFYGGGSIAYRMVDHNDDPATKLKQVHIETPDTAAEFGPPFDDGPPLGQPNLPVNFTSNGLTGGNLRANACHYERGQREGETRANGEHYVTKTVTTTGWTALISWKKRSGWDMVNVNPLGIKAFSVNNDVKLSLQLGAVLDGNENFTLPENASSGETAVLVDTAGDISTNGERRFVDTVAAGQGSATGAAASKELDFNLSSDKIVTLAAQAIGNNATVTGHVNWREFF